jgi:hypothetical protein
LPRVLRVVVRLLGYQDGLYEVRAEVTPPEIMSESRYDPPDGWELVIVADEPRPIDGPNGGA